MRAEPPIGHSAGDAQLQGERTKRPWRVACVCAVTTLRRGPNLLDPNFFGQRSRTRDDDEQKHHDRLVGQTGAPGLVTPESRNRSGIASSLGMQTCT